MAEAATRETVIVVHGTFAGESQNKGRGWYAPGAAFCDALDAALAAGGSRARCWQHVTTAEDYFHWDGANDWLSRSKAAARLRRDVQRLRADGWTVHLVGHSHGGNVIIEAISSDVGRVEPWFVGRVALLGTPIYGESAAFRERRDRLFRRWAVASLLIWAGLFAVSAGDVDLSAAFAIGGPTEFWAIAVALALATAAAVLLVRVVDSLSSRFGWLYMLRLKVLPLRAQASKLEERWSPPFLMINSQYDEAYRSLAGLPEGPNPLIDADARQASGAAGNLRAVVQSGRSRLASLIRDALETQRIRTLIGLGVAAVLVVLFWRPLLSATAISPSSPAVMSLAFWSVLMAIAVAAVIFDRFVFVPGILATDCVTALWSGVVRFGALSFDAQIKNVVWGFIKALSFGQSGAPQRVEDIEVSVMFDSSYPEDCVYLELPADIVAGVTEAQRHCIGEVQEILYRKSATWSPAELHKQLEAVDFPLVHTAYYRESECVQKMAEWIAEPMVKELDGRIRHRVTTPRGPVSGGAQAAILEDIEGPNHYRHHVEELKRRHGPRESKWGTRTNVDPFAQLR